MEDIHRGKTGRGVFSSRVFHSTAAYCLHSSAAILPVQMTAALARQGAMVPGGALARLAPQHIDMDPHSPRGCGYTVMVLDHEADRLLCAL